MAGRGPGPDPGQHAGTWERLVAPVSPLAGALVGWSLSGAEVADLLVAGARLTAGCDGTNVAPRAVRGLYRCVGQGMALVCRGLPSGTVGTGPEIRRKGARIMNYGPEVDVLNVSLFFLEIFSGPQVA